jgi:uncharacterized damage-inducible protein DinB
MAIRDALVPEWDQEMANTRKAIERIPDDKLGFRPHERSWTMAELITHLSNLPSWGVMTLAKTELDLEPGGQKLPPQPPVKTVKEALEQFDKNSKDTRALLAKTEDADFLQPWSLLKNGKNLMTLPRFAVMRGFVVSHIIHHRGQLTVYLRLAGIPVPAIYGASADEGAF